IHPWALATVATADVRTPGEVAIPRPREARDVCPRKRGCLPGDEVGRPPDRRLAAVPSVPDDDPGAAGRGVLVHGDEQARRALRVEVVGHVGPGPAVQRPAEPRLATADAEHVLLAPV